MLTETSVKRWACEMRTEMMVKEVSQLHECAQEIYVERFRDADTILSDIMNDADTEVSGVFEEIKSIFEKAISGEKSAEWVFKHMFSAFTGISFDTYLERCYNQITRK